MLRKRDPYLWILTQKVNDQKPFNGDSHLNMLVLKMCVNFHKQKYLNQPSEFASP